MDLIVYCADIGSIARGRFGWARLPISTPAMSCATGYDIAVLAKSIADDLREGYKVALGFECPLFVPLPEDPNGLTSARPGEGDRAWSAGAGAGSLATGLTETVWLLERVRQKLENEIEVFVDWREFQASPQGLFIWEAFVTKAAKARTHCGDAESAVRAFHLYLDEIPERNAVHCICKVRSLFGAALLQAGWTNDLQWLSKSCIVIRVLPLDDGSQSKFDMKTLAIQ